MKENAPSLPFVIELNAIPLRLGFREPSGPVHVLPIETPSSERYDKLIRQLAFASARFHAGHDDLKAVYDAVSAVVEFLHQDRAAVIGGVSHPLTQLATAISDTVNGARPPLFFARQRAQNRAGGTAFDTARGQMAAALDALMRAGEKAEEAASWLAGELAGYGIAQPNGQPINAITLSKWREKARQGNPRKVALMFHQTLQQEQRAKAVPRIQREEDARRWCRTLLDGLRTIFPKSPTIPGKA